MANKKAIKTIICRNGCSKSPKALSNFYKSAREEYEQYDGYCTTCKTCLRKSTIDENLNTVTMDSIKDALKKLDKPLIDSVFMEVKNNPEVTNSTFLGKYVSTINLKSKYKDCKYSDTVDIQIEQEKILNSKVDERTKIEVTDEMRRFWGRGLSNEDYLDLQENYDNFTANEKNMDYKKQSDYRTLCIYELQKSKIQFDLSCVGDVQKLQNLIDNLSSGLGIQAIQKMDEFSNDKLTLGLIARYHEDVKREPIRRWVEDFGNEDKIKDIVETYYLGGILQAMKIPNPKEREFKKNIEPYSVKISNAGGEE